MKAIWKSKSFYLALIPIVAGVLNVIQGELSSGAPLTIYGLLLIIVRFLTTEGVYTIKKPQ